MVFDPSRLPERLSRLNGAAWTRTLDVTVREPAPDLQPTTAVVQVYPTAEVLPENLLRLYVYFSAPMGMKGGADYIRLLDEDGHVVDDPFLPLDLALWNADRTRYTLLFDPGRVKRGILPNEQMGRSIVTGRAYTLVIDREWRDASGLPLIEPFSRRFSVGPPENRGIDPSEWQVATPVAGTRDPLVVSFRRPLDYALLQRALVVTTADGERVDGEIETEVAETRWILTPREPWRTSTYHLTARPVLEDPAGNRVGRPFEVALSERTARPGEASEVRVSFFPRQKTKTKAEPALTPLALTGVRALWDWYHEPLVRCGETRGCVSGSSRRGACLVASSDQENSHVPSRSRHSMTRTATTVASTIAVLVLAACQPAIQEDSAPMIPRLEGTEYPDLHGVWQALHTEVDPILWTGFRHSEGGIPGS